MAVPARLPPNLQKHAMFGALSESVRDLASDNIMCAVMLTGVMLLQVRGRRAHRVWPLTLQAGRYYSKRTSRHDSSKAAPADPNLRATGEINDPVAPSLTRRSATPFRELTEEEALELRGQT